MNLLIKNKLRGLLSIIGSRFEIVFNIRKIVHDIREYRYFKKLMIKRGDTDFLNEYKRFKKSDTVFILGSGSSINNISDEQWKIIKQKDSISFNLFLVHDHVPTYHFHEIPIKHGFRDGEVPFIKKVLAENKDTYGSTVPVIFRYRRFVQYGLTKEYFSEIKDNVFFILPHFVSTTNKKLLGLYINILKFINRISGKTWTYPVFYHAGSISLMISFAASVGYKKIITLGVDLNDNKYFWDNSDNPYYSVCRDLRKFLQDNYERHVTSDPIAMKNSSNNLPVEEFLYILNEKLLNKNGIELLVGNPESKLNERLSQYKWEN
ncbi:MAG: hypothetical protein LCH54_07525 [Bacteroidetes bacterium]|nr:hypothetical protein [Bacteroidota bacterium]